MALNPLGYVQVGDFGNSRVLNGTAREIISGGQVVGVSGTTGVVTSGASSYATDDVKFYINDDAEVAVGNALTDAASGASVGVLVDGLVLMSCTGSVFAGRKVQAADGTGVQNLGSQVIPADAEDASIAGNIFGRAYTAGASGGFALIHIKS